MRAGRLRQRIQLQSKATTADRTGTPTETWATYDTVWAEVKPLRGQEQQQGDQVQGRMTHLVTLRYHSSITIEHRIYFDSRYFDINAVANVYERNIYMELSCTEVPS